MCSATRRPKGELKGAGAGAAPLAQSRTTHVRDTELRGQFLPDHWTTPLSTSGPFFGFPSSSLCRAPRPPACTQDQRLEGAGPLGVVGEPRAPGMRTVAGLLPSVRLRLIKARRPASAHEACAIECSDRGDQEHRGGEIPAGGKPSGAIRTRAVHLSGDPDKGNATHHMRHTCFSGSSAEIRRRPSGCHTHQ